MNNYSWCGPSSLQISGWDTQIQMLSHIKVPMFWSEYGTNACYPAPRIFDEVLALYSPDVTGVLSGGCLYEFHTGANQYGLVETYPDGTVGRNRDFMNFRQNMAKVVEVLKSHPPVNTEGEEDHPEDWVGQFPDPKQGLGSWWLATSDIPSSPVDWTAVADRLRDEDWVHVEEIEVDEQIMTHQRLAIRTKNDIYGAVAAGTR